MLLFVLLTLVTTSLEAVAAFPHAEPFEHWKRQPAGPANSTQVDLGYSIYEGAVDPSTNLITFKGCAVFPIRYMRSQINWVQNPICISSHRKAAMAGAPSSCLKSQCCDISCIIRPKMSSVPKKFTRGCGVGRRRGLPVSKCLRPAECNQEAAGVRMDPWGRLWARRWHSRSV